jgi:hypothetical protein
MTDPILTTPGLAFYINPEIPDTAYTENPVPQPAGPGDPVGYAETRGPRCCLMALTTSRWWVNPATLTSCTTPAALPWHSRLRRPKLTPAMWPWSLSTRAAAIA